MMNVVHLCDCMDFMKGIPDKYYELAIVDPPYGGVTQGGYMTNQMGGGVAKNRNDYHLSLWGCDKPSIEYFNELVRVSKNQIIWGGNYFTTLLNNDSQCWIVWDKQKPKGVSFADVELAYTSFNLASRIFRFAWNGMIQGNMKNKEYKIHPTQKPVALYRWLLENYAKPGDKIFDSHVGSGSSRIACHEMGFDFEGCEIDKDYWEAQEKRYRIFLAQPDLFAPKATYAEQPDIF
jgi:site-specific DNA-methyltransferase (adenine-specific)